MQAIVLSQQGPPQNLEPKAQPKPRPGPGEALIKVSHAGVNFGETMQRAGAYPIPIATPVVLGSEVFGVIEALGPGVDSVRPGDKVFALLIREDGTFSSGGYAEYAVAPIERTYPARDSVDEATSLALLSQGLTALWLLEKAAQLRRGQSIFIHAAGGGVGSIAVQLAKHMGAATIVGAAGSASKREFVMALGATACIDSRSADWPSHARTASGGAGFDVILDPLGGDDTAANLSALAPFGHVVVFGGMSGRMPALTDQHWGGVIFQNQRISGFANMAYLMDKTDTRLAIARLLDMAASGALRVESTVFALADAADAHAALEARTTIGKVVLKV